MLTEKDIEMCIKLLESVLNASIDDDVHAVALRSYIAALAFVIYDEEVKE